MAQTMTASKTITDGQIDNVVDKLRAALRKHRSEFSSDIAQQVLGVENLGMELYAVVRKHAERFSAMIVRLVKVDRSRTPKAALDATGRTQYVTDSVVAAMPRGGGEEVEVILFKPDPEAYTDGWISCAAVEKEYEKRGLVPDPRALVAVNEDDPAFADERPNACQWKDKDGHWCYAAFGRWLGERFVFVYRRDDGWSDDWWFAGVRK